MRIEKINDSQIRCFLTKEDLDSRDLKLSELAYGSEKAKDLFRELMRWAAYKFNFDADNIPLMIEAIPLSAESLLLIVSKVPYPDEFDSRFSDFTDAPEGYEDWDDYDYDDYSMDDDWYDGSDPLFNPFRQPQGPQVPAKGPNAHEILEQYQSNAVALAAAEAALNTLAGNAINAVLGRNTQTDGSAADSGNDIVQRDDGTVMETADGYSETGDQSEQPPAVESVDILPGAPVPEVKTPRLPKVPLIDGNEKPADVSGRASVPSPSGTSSGLTPASFAAALQNAFAKTRRGGTSGNYARMFCFDSIDEITEIAPFITRVYKGMNYLYRDRDGRYHLIVTMEGEEPVRYNKVINILNEFASPEKLSHETTGFLDEHDNLIIAKNALQRLAEL